MSIHFLWTVWDFREKITMSNYCVLRFEKVKSVSELAGRSRHNLRKGVLPDHVDQSKVSLNATIGDAEKRFAEITSGKVMRKNGVLAVEALLSFSPEMIGKINPDQWGLESVRWAEKEFGEGNILEAALHLDEKTPHLHIMFVPRDEKGKWNWRGICKGREGLRDLQTRYAKAMEPFGLKRGEPKVDGFHIPPAVKRELDKLKETGEKAVVKKEQDLLQLVRSFFGEDRYLEFLKWAKTRSKKAEEVKKLQADLTTMEMP